MWRRNFSTFLLICLSTLLLLQIGQVRCQAEQQQRTDGTILQARNCSSICLHTCHSSRQIIALFLQFMSAAHAMQVGAARHLQVLPGNPALHERGRLLLQSTSSLSSSTSTDLHRQSVCSACITCLPASFRFARAPAAAYMK